MTGALALDSGVRLFGCGMGGLRTGFATDGIHFALEQTISEIKGCDPAAVKLSNGRYALLYKIVDLASSAYKIDESKKLEANNQEECNLCSYFNTGSDLN